MSYKPSSGGSQSRINTSADVVLNNIADKQILQYDSSSSVWRNVDPSALGVATLGRPIPAAAATTNTVSVSWSSVSGATAYIIYLDNVQQGGEQPETTYLFANLMPDTTYNIGVKAVNDSGQESSIASVTTQTEPQTGTSTIALAYSTSTNRSLPVPLNGASNLSAEGTYVFTYPDTTNIASVSFVLDGGTPYSEVNPPYDFRGANASNLPNPINTTNGSHTLVATVTYKDGTPTATLTASFSSTTGVLSAPTITSKTVSDQTVSLVWSAISGATGYKVWRNSAVITTTSGTALNDSGLTNNTTYTYEISATNGTVESAKSTAVTATPVADSGGTGTPGDYGPDGTAWPANTPAYTSAATAILSDFVALETRLATANAGDVFYLNTCSTSTGASAGKFYLDSSAAKTRLQNIVNSGGNNVLVRPAPGAVITVSAELNVTIPGITFAGFRQTGIVRLAIGSTRVHLARFRVSDSSQLYISDSTDHDIVEWTKPNRGTGNDPIQIKRDDNGPAPANLRFVRCWVARNDNPPVHTDTVQFTAATGNTLFQNTFLDQAGSNRTVQIGRETQPAGVPYQTLTFDTVFFGGTSSSTAAGNVTSSIADAQNKGPAFYNCEFDQMLSEYNNSAWRGPRVFTGNRVEPAAPKTVAGVPYPTAFPSNTYGVTVTPPTFVAPPWWNTI